MQETASEKRLDHRIVHMLDAVREVVNRYYGGAEPGDPLSGVAATVEVIRQGADGGDCTIRIHAEAISAPWERFDGVIRKAEGK